MTRHLHLRLSKFHRRRKYRRKGIITIIDRRKRREVQTPRRRS
jgi:hypothetical protein